MSAATAPTPKLRRPCQVRTQKVIEYFRGLPGEFEMLKGVMCAAHPWADSTLPHKEYVDERKWQERYERLLDTDMIAARMDELNRGAAAEATSEAAVAS